MANILTAAEGANVLRCETTDAEMLALLPLVDAHIKTATGRDWAADTTIRTEAKSAARMLLVRWHEDPGGIGAGSALGFGLSACLMQLKAIALELESAGVPDEALAIKASQPVDGAIDVAVAANLVVIFNHPMAAGATSAVTLATATGVNVAVTNSLDVTARILTVNPNSNLDADTGYVLTILDAADSYGQTIFRHDRIYHGMNLNGKVSNPGEMHTSVTLQRRSVTTGTGGFQTPAWSTIATVWAKWVNVHGTEAWTAASLQAEAAATVTIRYRNDLDPTCAILKGSDRFEIVSMDNIQERSEYIELKVRRMRSG